MFHKVKEVFPLRDMKLCVRFVNGSTKHYDVGGLAERFPRFEALRDGHLFEDVQVDAGGYGVVWSDELDLSCDELWNHGVEAETPFDGLMPFFGCERPLGSERIDSSQGRCVRQDIPRFRRAQIRQAVGRVARCHVS